MRYNSTRKRLNSSPARERCSIGWMNCCDLQIVLLHDDRRFRRGAVPWSQSNPTVCPNQNRVRSNASRVYVTGPCSRRRKPGILPVSVSVECCLQIRPETSVPHHPRLVSRYDRCTMCTTAGTVCPSLLQCVTGGNVAMTVYFNDVIVFGKEHAHVRICRCFGQLEFEPQVTRAL